MVKLLIKKELTELFRSYFVDSKTGKAKTKKQTILMFCLFGVLMLFLCVMFFGIASSIGTVFFGSDYEWLFFALMGILAIAMGLFGSVFNTFAMLYQSKDNEFLLSLPIAPSVILTSRVAAVLAMSLLYETVVWLPASVYYWIFAKPSVSAVIFDVLLIFVIGLFVSVLTCALGWVIAIISSKLKRKSFITVIISLVFFGAYYFVCMRMSDIITKFIANQEQIGGVIKSWLFPVYEMSCAATGKAVSFVIFLLITLALCAICWYILNKSFIKIVTTNRGEKKIEYKHVEAKASGIKSALLRREAKRFSSSALYMLNTALGIVIVAGIGILMIIKSPGLNVVIGEFSESFPFIKDCLPLASILIICAVLSMDVISTPSVSLEGKTLWLIRSLPAAASDVLNAKLLLHIYVNGAGALIGAILLGIAFDLDISMIIYTAAFSILFVYVTGYIGLIFGLKRPNFTWTNESTPIKQSLNVLFVMLISVVIPIIAAGLFFLCKDFVEISDYLLIWIVVLALSVRLLGRWLNTKGAAIFDSL